MQKLSEMLEESRRYLDTVIARLGTADEDDGDAEFVAASVANIVRIETLTERLVQCVMRDFGVSRDFAERCVDSDCIPD